MAASAAATSALPLSPDAALTMSFARCCISWMTDVEPERASSSSDICTTSLPILRMPPAASIAARLPRIADALDSSCCQSAALPGAPVARRNSAIRPRSRSSVSNAPSRPASAFAVRAGMACDNAASSADPAAPPDGCRYTSPAAPSSATATSNATVRNRLVVSVFLAMRCNPVNNFSPALRPRSQQRDHSSAACRNKLLSTNSNRSKIGQLSSPRLYSPAR